MIQANGLFLSLAAVACCGLAYVMVFGDSVSNDRPILQQSEFAKPVTPARRDGVSVAPEAWRAYARTEPSSATEVVSISTARSPRAAAEPPPAQTLPMPADRAAIVREMQRHLTRVGCYEGEISGTWTPGTRKAMEAFTDRVNAALPVGEPDQILLALVQGYQGKACGACPTGQSFNDDGRCVPNAILAKAADKSKRVTHTAAAAGAGKESAAITGWAATTSITATIPAPQAPPMEGRMALAGPDGAPPEGSTADPAQTQTAAPPAAPAKSSSPPRRSSAPAKFGPSIFRRLDGGT
jgi:hypothetical protein